MQNSTQPTTEVKRQRLTPPWPADVGLKVLEVDDLLRKILFRLALPSDLIHAALVCKNWLHIISDPAFLRRFRELHPPLILGFYIKLRGVPIPKFVSMPHPKELTGVIRRAESTFDAYSGVSLFPMNCQNGRLLIRLDAQGYRSAVLSPMNSAIDMVILPPLPTIKLEEGMIYYPIDGILIDASGSRRTYLSAGLVVSHQQATVHLYELQDGVWIHKSFAIEQLVQIQSHVHRELMSSAVSLLLVKHKLYIVGSKRKILELDLASSVFSSIDLPAGVEHIYDGDLKLSRRSREDDPGFNVVHKEGSQLRVWLYNKTDNCSAGNWLLLHTICLFQICTTLGMQTFENMQNPIVRLHAVGDDAEFVFLVMWAHVVYLDIKSRAVKKLYLMSQTDLCIDRIHPFMMTWPPVFPVLKGRSEQEE